MNRTIYLLVFGLLSCNVSTEKISANSPEPKAVSNTLKLHKLQKLFVVGNFSGNGSLDTIFQHNVSGLTGAEIVDSPDPFQIDYDSVAKWFYDQNADVYLAGDKNNQDTLHLGVAQGLYCLINIGDINRDKKDEIALVVDYCDFSRLNSCKIFSLCKGKWTQLNRFGLLEDAFDYTADMTNTPIFDNIKNYLEKQNGNWFYNDYEQSLNSDDFGKMKELTVDKCYLK